LSKVVNSEINHSISSRTNIQTIHAIQNTHLDWMLDHSLGCILPSGVSTLNHKAFKRFKPIRTFHTKEGFKFFNFRKLKEQR